MDVYIDSLLLCAGVMNYLCLDIAAKIMTVTPYYIPTGALKHRVDNSEVTMPNIIV